MPPTQGAHKFLADMHNGNDPYVGLVKNFGMKIGRSLTIPKCRELAEANKDMWSAWPRVRNKLDEEYEKNMDGLEDPPSSRGRGMTDEQIDDVAAPSVRW